MGSAEEVLSGLEWEEMLGGLEVKGLEWELVGETGLVGSLKGPEEKALVGLVLVSEGQALVVQGLEWEVLVLVPEAESQALVGEDSAVLGQAMP